MTPGANDWHFSVRHKVELTVAGRVSEGTRRVANVDVSPLEVAKVEVGSATTLASAGCVRCSNSEFSLLAGSLVLGGVGLLSV